MVWVLYFMGTALLVITNIAQTQKWASGSDPTLLFEKRTERMYVYKLERVYVLYFYIHNVVGGVVNCLNLIYGGRTSLFLSSQRMPAATDACICVYNCKTKQFYECERNNLCINTYTPHVAATSFFAGEVEIFDFVTERVKRCIAAKGGRGGGSLKTHNDGWNWNLIKCLGSIFYEHSVVGGSTYSMYTKMGGGTHSACSYGDVVVVVLQKNKCHIMRRDMTRRYGCGC